MLTHVLDTSAWLAHLLLEPDHEIVSLLLIDPANKVGISSLSIVEVHARMKTLKTVHKFPSVMAEYQDVFAGIIPASEEVAFRAIELRQESVGRIPAIDSMIAATAATQNAILVHRDPHFQTIPENQLQQLVLAAPQ